MENKIFLQADLEDKEIDNMFKKKEQKDKLRNAKVIIADAGFWENAGTVLLLLHPINDALATFEGDDSSVSAVYDQFNRLATNKVYRDQLTSSAHNLRFLQNEIIGLIATRRQSMMTPSMRIGFLLDQRMGINGINDKERQLTIK
ncbi:hypothetical protein BBJ28_00018864 [Nothophytophthora sp. Chile5]|nr:hypothetical protein BBJ28_00018864 [Nothophytophthora sp. Chile5]